MAVLPTGFGKSLLVRLIPGFGVELQNAPDPGVPGELEHRFERVFPPFVVSPTDKILFVIFSV